MANADEEGNEPMIQRILKAGEKASPTEVGKGSGVVRILLVHSFTSSFFQLFKILGPSIIT